MLNRNPRSRSRPDDVRGLWQIIPAIILDIPKFKSITYMIFAAKIPGASPIHARL